MKLLTSIFLDYENRSLRPEDRTTLVQALTNDREARAAMAKHLEYSAAIARALHHQEVAQRIDRIRDRAIVPVRERTFRRWIAIAALFLIGVGGILFRMQSFSSQGPEMVWKGEVTLSHHARVMAPQEGIKLPEGCDITIGRTGSARLSYPDGTRLALAAQTRMKLSRTGIILTQGSIEGAFAKRSPDFPFEMDTPHGTIRVVGTSFTLDVGAKALFLIMKAGRIEFQHPRGTKILSMGEKEAMIASVDQREPWIFQKEEMDMKQCAWIKKMVLAGTLSAATIVGTLSAGEENIVMNPGFETIVEEVPSDWQGVNKFNVKLATGEDGNHFITIAEKVKGPGKYIWQTIELESSWQSLLVTARVRTTNFKPGDESWKNARVAVTFLDSNGKIFVDEKGQKGYGPSPSVNGNTDWVTIRNYGPIPRGAHSVEIKPAHFGSEGIVEFDDITVIPNPTLPMIETPFKPGTFEEIPPKEVLPLGWTSEWPENAKVVSEGNNHFLRMWRKEGENGPGIYGFFALPESWETIKLSAKFRARNLTIGEKGDQKPHVQALFHAEDGTILSKWNVMVYIDGNSSDWLPKEGTFNIQPGAKWVTMKIKMPNCVGEVDIDDIAIQKGE